MFPGPPFPLNIVRKWKWKQTKRQTNYKYILASIWWQWRIFWAKCSFWVNCNWRPCTSFLFSFSLRFFSSSTQNHKTLNNDPEEYPSPTSTNLNTGFKKILAELGGMEIMPSASNESEVLESHKLWRPPYDKTALTVVASTANNCAPQETEDR